MSANVPIQGSNITAPTPQNTPLATAPISGMSRPTVPDISEEPEAAEELSALGAAGMQSAMLGMVQGKLAGLVGRSSGYVESLPLPVRRNVEGLKAIQIKQTELQNQYKRECLELERKDGALDLIDIADSFPQYLELQKPLYTRRHEIILGTSTATDDEVAAAQSTAEAAAQEDDEEFTPLPTFTPSPDDVKGIPEFWLTALRNHPGLAELITDRDAEALAFLKNITLAYLPKTGEPGDFAGKPGFTITFHWDENPFFTNSTLTKTYIYQEEVGYSGDFVYDRAVGSQIAWKDDKDLTREWEIKKQRNKNTNRTRLVRKSHPTASFFNFFTPPVMPNDEDVRAFSSVLGVVVRTVEVHGNDGLLRMLLAGSLMKSSLLLFVQQRRQHLPVRTGAGILGRASASVVDCALPAYGDDIESGDVDPEDLEEIEDRLEMDYQIGEDFKEKIIPRAVDYFTGKALEYELADSDDDDFEDDDEDDEDEDDEEDEFDEDSEDEDVGPARRGPPRRRGGAPGGGGGAANVSAEECKQQ
ncbi:NAP-domain-containing protein [Mycena chlorophos]|uniref:NAP-domain-containing protein n=1 Tax=Mycena chlorophos TaxID=658473 RepID=A0A8H6SRL3_MYCCL|nr:NAP-domain-containing protein [Mycena chlorophos]